MKKIGLYLVILLSVIACTEDGYILEDIGNEIEERALKYAGDGEYDVLGFGYDITGEFLHPMSVKSPVVDIERYKEKYPRRLVTGTTGWGFDKLNYGYSAVDYTSNVAASFGLDLGNIFSGTIKNSAFFSFGSAYSHKYSFASLDIIRNKKYIYINDEVDRIAEYASEEFLEDMDRLSPERLIRRYGTHVLLDFTLGGRYKLTYKSVITNTKNTATKRSTVKSGLGVTLKKIGLSVNTGGSIEANETLAKENKRKELYVSFYGGSGSGLVYDLEQGMPTSVDIQSWEDRLELTNSALTEINWEETYPIYEFIEDPAKKEQIKNAVQKYIDDSAVEDVKLAPFRSYFTSLSGNILTLYTTIDAGAGWVYQGNVCFVLDEQAAGSVPLYQYEWLGRRSYSTGESMPGWRKEGLVCYIYPDQKDGTVPLYQYASNKGYWSYSTAESITGFVREVVVGYVYPID